MATSPHRAPVARTLAAGTSLPGTGMPSDPAQTARIPVPAPATASPSLPSTNSNQTSLVSTSPARVASGPTTEPVTLVPARPTSSPWPSPILTLKSSTHLTTLSITLETSEPTKTATPVASNPTAPAQTLTRPEDPSILELSRCPDRVWENAGVGPGISRGRSPETAQSEGDFESDTESDGTGRDSQGLQVGRDGSAASSETDPPTGAKRRRSPLETGRTAHARSRPAVPTYHVKRSKKAFDQQRGVDWLTRLAKHKFDQTLETLLAQWGVRPGHRGTCVLLPEAWKALDPPDLMAMFENYKHPPPGSARAWYSHSDHATTLARAAAWFARWPRTGLELDNFLGCGPFKPMDASHLCHHDHCIVHLTYEPADVNLDRIGCCDEARFLRQDGRSVPEHCSKHTPPCLMQHAALTPRETYHVQFAVLRRARGEPSTPPIPRPRRYLYPTFESQLPCSFPAVTLDSDELVDEVPPAKKEGRPDLFCVFCPQIKSYASINGLWVHLVHKHNEIGDQARLEEVRRTASLWREYWRLHSDGGKRGNPTQAKLDQIEAEGFGWHDVLDWALRS